MATILLYVSPYTHLTIVIPYVTVLVVESTVQDF